MFDLFRMMPALAATNPCPGLLPPTGAMKPFHVPLPPVPRKPDVEGLAAAQVAATLAAGIMAASGRTHTVAEAVELFERVRGGLAGGEIQVTPEMLAAGRGVLDTGTAKDIAEGWVSCEDVLESIFQEMSQLLPRK